MFTFQNKQADPHAYSVKTKKDRLMSLISEQDIVRRVWANANTDKEQKAAWAVSEKLTEAINNYDTKKVTK